MRKLTLVFGLLAVVLCLGAVPAYANDGDLLGSGFVAPENGEAPAAPVTSVEKTSSRTSAGEDMLAATGLDSGVLLLVGLGLLTAGGAALATARRRAHA